MTLPLLYTRDNQYGLCAPIHPITLRIRLNHLLQILHLCSQLPNLHNRHISLNVRLRTLHLLRPAIRLKIHLSSHLLPFLCRILITLAMPAIMPNGVSLPSLHERCYEQQWGVDHAHDVVVEALVALSRHPPFEREDEEEDFYEVEGSDEDVFIGGTDELHGFQGEESHEFVDGVVGDVGVGAVVEGDEDVEEDFVVSVSSNMLTFTHTSGGSTY